MSNVENNTNKNIFYKIFNKVKHCISEDMYSKKPNN